MIAVGGLQADFCVFDAGSIIDHASFAEPTPAGHRHRTVFRRRLRSRLP